MTADKMDTHYHQQLSALMDGDLPADEARFLLRRLQHDNELTGCWERWQLCGDALRGQAQAPAPAGFAERIAQAVAAEPTTFAVTAAGPSRKRSSLGKWGGGALAASVAVVALFMVRQQVPDEAPVPATASVASQSAGQPSGSALPALQTAAVGVASVAVATTPRRQNTNQPRRSATRAQQASRSSAASRLPDRAVAIAAASVPVVHAIASGSVNTSNGQRDPFSNVQMNAPSARPWPRAVLPQYPSGSGAFNTGYSTDRATQAFYPFEPRQSESLPARPVDSAPQD